MRATCHALKAPMLFGTRPGNAALKPPESADPQVGTTQRKTHQPASTTPTIPPAPSMPETTPTKPQKQRKYYLKTEEKEGLKNLLNDEKVVEGLKQHHEENPKINLEQKIRAIVADPSGETLLTQKEAIALKKFMDDHKGFDSQTVDSTKTLLKKSAAKIVGQWAIMFTVSLAAMTASGAIAAAAAG